MNLNPIRWILNILEDEWKDVKDGIDGGDGYDGNIIWYET